MVDSSSDCVKSTKIVAVEALVGLPTDRPGVKSCDGPAQGSRIAVWMAAEVHNCLLFIVLIDDNLNTTGVWVGIAGQTVQL